MPTAQLLTAVVESAFNAVLKLDEGSDARLKPLQGKVFSLAVDVLPLPLVFHFSDRVEVLSGDEHSPDCALTVQASILPELKDASQLTRLIKEGKLSLEGDIHIAQHFSALVSDLDIDLGGVIAPYTGDVVAHHLVSGARKLAASIKHAVTETQQVISEGAIEEKQIAAPAIAVAHFNDEVTRLRNDAERLTARVEQLISKRKG